MLKKEKPSPREYTHIHMSVHEDIQRKENWRDPEVGRYQKFLQLNGMLFI
jgi:hypothetical protein